jgi:hypothetical protein
VTCLRLPTIHGIICYETTVRSRVKTRGGRVYHFEFDPKWGPLVVTARGEPVERQPQGGSSFWPAFDAWLRRRHRREAKRGEAKP